MFKGLPMKYILIYILLFSFYNAFSQDPNFSQPYANPVYLNPAYCGSSGGMRIIANHRDQWSRVPGTFTTTTFSMDVSEPCMRSGWGINAMRDVEGEGFLNTSKAGLIYQYGFLTNIRKRTYIGMATGASFGTMSIDWDKLEFSDQFHPHDGKIYGSGALRPENLKRNFADMDFGIIINHKFYYKLSKDENMWTAGLAVHHLYQAGETIMGDSKENFMPRRYTLHGGVNLGVRGNKRLRGGYVFPHFAFNYQPTATFKPAFTDLTVGVNAYKIPFLLGLAYQNAQTPAHLKNTNALSIIAGFQQPFRENMTSYQITYSYDINLSGLSFSTYGSHELSLVIFFDGKSVFCGGGTGDGSRGASGKSKESNCLRVKRSGFMAPF